MMMYKPMNINTKEALNSFHNLKTENNSFISVQKKNKAKKITYEKLREECEQYGDISQLGNISIEDVLEKVQKYELAYKKVKPIKEGLYKMYVLHVSGAFNSVCNFIEYLCQTKHIITKAITMDRSEKGLINSSLRLQFVCDIPVKTDHEQI